MQRLAKKKASLPGLRIDLGRPVLVAGLLLPAVVDAIDHDHLAGDGVHVVLSEGLPHIPALSALHEAAVHTPTSLLLLRRAGSAPL